MASPLYIGFDLSTQQLKGLVVSSDLKVEYEAKFDFDAHSHGFNIKKGVLTNEAEHEVFAPVALWLQALDWVLNTLNEQGLDFGRVKGISGAGQQHGSVYWSADAERLMKGLDRGKKLEEQLAGAFSHPFSPNWQDASTQKECDEFDAYLGGPEELAEVTGSKAHHVRSLFHCVQRSCRLTTLFVAIHWSSDLTFPPQISRAIQENVKDITCVFIPSVTVPRQHRPLRYLRRLWNESMEHQSRIMG